MKHPTKSHSLLLSAAGLGALGLVLGRLLYALALDSRGLLVRNHPLAYLLCLLIPAALVLVVSGVHKCTGAQEYPANFGPILWAALGHVLAAMAIALTVLTANASALGEPGALWRILGVLAVLGLLPAAWFRLRGKQPPFACYLALCLFLLSHLVSNYRQWCADPQILNYLFELLGIGMWMLFSYYCACFCVGLGKRRMQLATGLLTVVFCLTNLGTGGNLLLSLGGVAFAATNLCRPVCRKEAP